MSDEKSIFKMSKRELFEEVKDLKDAIKSLREDCNDPDMLREMPYLPNAVGSCIYDYNQRYKLLFNRMYKKSRIFRKPVFY